MDLNIANPKPEVLPGGFVRCRMGYANPQPGTFHIIFDAHAFRYCYERRVVRKKLDGQIEGMPDPFMCYINLGGSGEDADILVSHETFEIIDAVKKARKE